MGRIMVNNPQLYQLPNGIQVVLDSWPSKTCAISVCFPFRPDVNGPKGLAHFCEHMIVNSGTRYPDGIHTDGLAGCRLNATTNYDGVWLHGEMLPNRVKTILDVFSDGLKNRVFRPDVLERERNAVRDEFYRGNNDLITTDIIPDVSACKSIKDYVIGTVDSINNFTCEQVIDFINRNFTKSNCIVALSGRFDSDILNYITEKFDFLPSGPINVRKSPLFPYTPCVMKITSPTARRTSLAAINALDANLTRSPDNKYKWLCHEVMLGWIRDNMRRDLRRLIYTSSLTTFEDVSKILLLMIAECQPDKNQVQALYAQMAQTCYRSIHQDKITRQFIDTYRQNERFGMAQLLSDASQRCKVIIENIMKYYRVVNWQSEMTALRKLKRKEVIENTRDIFCPDTMSHALKGQDLGVDLKQIWNENFGPANKIIMATHQKSDKIH